MTSTMPLGFSYVSDFLSHQEHDRCVEQIRALPFVHDKGRYGVLLKRSYAQFGYAYVTVGRKLIQAPPLPAWLQLLAKKAGAHCPDGVLFNQAIITHYSRTAGIGWHMDAPCFRECIVGISFVGIGVLQFRPNGTEDASHELRVTPGSLYIMTGPARYDFQHQVKPVKTDRYSLTLRHVPDTPKG